MTKAAELAKMGEVLTNSQIGGRRNIVINGAMQVAQRGTSTSSYTSDGYSVCDRWMYRVSSLGTWTISQDSTTPNGFGNSTKWDCTTADASPSAGDTLTFSQRIEGQNLQQLKKGTSDAEKVTVSFYVNSNKTGTYIVELYDADNTRHISKSYTINSANTWEQKIITFEGDTTGAFVDDNARSLDLNFWLGSGTNFTSGTLATSWASVTSANRAVGQVNLGDSTDNNWYITGIQMEIGSVATPFEHRSFGEELALAQRYFYKWESSSTYAGVGVGRAYDTSNAVAMINTPCAMRANATVTISAVGDFAIAGIGGTPAAISNGERTTDFRSYKLTVNQGSTPFTTGTIYQLESDNQANAKINFDSEL